MPQPRAGLPNDTYPAKNYALVLHSSDSYRISDAQSAGTIGAVGRGRAGARPAGQIRPHVDAADDRDPLAEPTGRSGRAHNPRALLLLSPDRLAL